MRLFKLPYHTDTLSVEIPDQFAHAGLDSRAHEYIADKCEAELVEEALDAPIGSEPLESLAAGKKNMVILTSDHTRPVPSHVTLPILLRRIRGANPGIDITILISTGTHRATSHEEMIGKFGAQIVNNEKIVVHDPRRREDMASLGTLETGLNAEVNRLILETGLLIAEGFIEPHFFAGFSGGRKSVFPGVASLLCVKGNHCAQYIANPCARTGVLEGNPIHIEAKEIARRAGLKFILNVALDKDKKIIKAFAGHFDEAHLAGCEFVRGLSSVKAAYSDIVITTNGGYPLDQNVYQAVKGMTAAEACCKEGGVIIQAAACSDGHGSQSFYETFANAASPAAVTGEIISRGRADTADDQWESQILARILEKHKVIMVSFPENERIIRGMFMDYAPDLGSALALARKYTREDAMITVIPDGVSVIVEQ